MNNPAAGPALAQAETETKAQPETDRAARYKRARQDWDERFSFHAQAAQKWRRLGLGGVMVGLFGIGYGLWVDGQSEFKPFIVKVDELGQSETIRNVETISEWPKQMVKRDLSDFVNWTRSVPADREVMVSNFRRVFTFLTAGDPAETMVKEIGRSPTLSPFRIAETRTRSVEIISVNFVGGSSWLVEWRETTRARGNGKVLEISKYKGTYVLQKAKRLSEEIITYNPLGMRVEHFDIQKLN
ncbi:VirB8/TrbF family protein [uncultured Ruegeria sp.]|uniref:VirB8/TrbF family protein n=1 Tax=uncultured Ruegeria sp. TaxID=259304 RepID=UPI0026068081|nr:VirB8/TrbF family protein [uncultured Ruegeria sp.]